MSPKLPWPKFADYVPEALTGDARYLLNYERAMKEAYAARLKLAVEALNKLSADVDYVLHKRASINGDGHIDVLSANRLIKADKDISKALAAIGEVPQG